MGGDSIVEVTTEGIEPDYEFLREVSKATGVNIVCSTGYYLGHSLTDEIKNTPVDELVKVLVVYFNGFESKYFYLFIMEIIILFIYCSFFYVYFCVLL